MIHNADILPDEATALAGDLRGLLNQLGEAEQVFPTAAFPVFPRVIDLESLHAFLRIYQSEILLPLELPTILQAYQYSCSNEARELIALDQRLSQDSRLQPFAAASQRIGRGHLKRLRPLRDERVAQRYLEAVERGRASGSHTIVFGLSLAIYSLPLRQGLASYAEQTLRGFYLSAVRDLQLPTDPDETLLTTVFAELRPAMDQLFIATQTATLRIA